MNTSSLIITAPGVIEQKWSEAELLGGITWLWMHSASHRNFPLHSLPILLLPALKNQQFIFASEVGKPVFYLSWAHFSIEAEKRYLANHPLLMPEADWNSGDRMWILDWVAPFGHTKEMSQILKRRIFSARWMRALYHRGKERGLKVITFQGTAVVPEEAEEWFKNHPIAYSDSEISKKNSEYINCCEKE